MKKYLVIILSMALLTCGCFTQQRVEALSLVNSTRVVLDGIDEILEMSTLISEKDTENWEVYEKDGIEYIRRKNTPTNSEKYVTPFEYYYFAGVFSAFIKLEGIPRGEKIDDNIKLVVYHQECYKPSENAFMSARFSIEDVEYYVYYYRARLQIPKDMEVIGTAIVDGTEVNVYRNSGPDKVTTVYLKGNYEGCYAKICATALYRKVGAAEIEAQLDKIGFFGG